MCFCHRYIAHLFVFSLLEWLLKCAKLAKLELAPAFMLGGAAKMSPPKSLRRSNLLSWNCCWWVCPRLTTGDWWRQEMDLKKTAGMCWSASINICACLWVLEQPSHKDWGRQETGLFTLYQCVFIHIKAFVRKDEIYPSGYIWPLITKKPDYKGWT